MCAVIGVFSKNIINTSFIKLLMQQSMIRGKHATGVSYLLDNTLVTNIKAQEASNFDFQSINTKLFIGHTRYSTSSLEYNQPIYNDNLSIVHNGVITQEDSSSWEKYNYNFKTKNDSEFILKSFEENTHPINDYPEASIASIVLDKKNKHLHFFRNEKRPLYFKKTNDCIVIASTKDILIRSGISDPNKCKSCYDYKVDCNINVEETKLRKSFKDLQ